VNRTIPGINRQATGTLESVSGVGMQPIETASKRLGTDRDQWPGVAVARPAISLVDEDWRGDDMR